MDARNFYYFTGTNTHALDAELAKWKQLFRTKHGEENMMVLRGKDAKLTDILDAVSTMPFIAEKRLVIIDGTPRIEKEDVRLLVENIHPQTVLVIVDAKPDKRIGAVKELEKVAQCKTFVPLSSSALGTWIQSEVRSLGSSISTEAARSLLEIVGADQQMLATELRKIAAFAGAVITTEHIEEMAVPSGTQVIWKLTDLVGSNKADEALRFLAYRIERGEDPYGMWVIILNMIKNLTLAVAAVADGNRDERSVAQVTGLNPFAVRGLMPLARTMNLSRMKALVDWAVNADLALKTGGYHYTADHQGEVIALTERAILMCA